jgi:hypothetical protein
MNIQLNKFGTTLISRQLGKESFAAFSPVIKDVPIDEVVIIDFDGIDTFAPSWGDEFLTPLYHKHGDNLVLKNTNNQSVIATIKILERTNEMKFNVDLE